MASWILAPVLLLTASLSSTREVSLKFAREAYFGMETARCNALMLAERFEKNPPSDPLLMAYYGASSAAAPNCLFNPASKIAYFRRGKSLLAESVRLQPQSFEIRFLRFATQSKTPSFLGYNGNLDEDRRFLIANIDQGREEVSDSKIFSRMVRFLLDSDALSRDDKARLSAKATDKTI